MEDYGFACPSAEFDTLAHVICDCFPEQTRFVEASDDAGRFLSVQWLAMRFGSTPKRMTLDVRIARDALARYVATRPALRARGHAVLRAYVEATLGSLEERHADGEAVPREMEISLGDEFA